MSANYDRDIESVADLISAADEGVQIPLECLACLACHSWHMITW